MRSVVSEPRTPNLQVGRSVEPQINVGGKTKMFRAMRSNIAISGKLLAATARMYLTTEDSVRVQTQQVDQTILLEGS